MRTVRTAKMNTDTTACCGASARPTITGVGMVSGMRDAVTCAECAYSYPGSLFPLYCGNGLCPCNDMDVPPNYGCIFGQRQYVRGGDMKVSRTEHGFEIIEFADHTGARCSLQQSSLADFVPPGSSAVWFGVQVDRMHLDVELVEQLLPHLQQWVETGSLVVPDGPA